MAEYFLFIVGLTILVKGADLLVFGGTLLAKRLGVSELVIGLSIVAVGTSLPELFVITTASLRGSADLAIANVIGSNISNLLLVLGISATISPIIVNREFARREFPISMFAALLFMALANDKFFGGANSILSRLDGLILLGCGAGFLLYLYKSFKFKPGELPDLPGDHKINVWEAGAKVCGGILFLVLGGQLVVGEASIIASDLGVSQAFVGLFIIAIGTTLPELATSAIAAYKKNSELAVGNIVGSTIANVFLVLGTGALVSPLAFDERMNYDLTVMLSATALMLGVLFFSRKNTIGRWFGAASIALYAAYLFWSISFAV